MKMKNTATESLQTEVARLSKEKYTNTSTSTGTDTDTDTDTYTDTTRMPKIIKCWTLRHITVQQQKVKLRKRTIKIK